MILYEKFYYFVISLHARSGASTENRNGSALSIYMLFPAWSLHITHNKTQTRCERTRAEFRLIRAGGRVADNASCLRFARRPYTASKETTSIHRSRQHSTSSTSRVGRPPESYDVGRRGDGLCGAEASVVGRRTHLQHGRLYRRSPPTAKLSAELRNKRSINFLIRRA
ncbi:hypothetical protein EVAR_4027_1 [Eumeta japonica]|uniref:Uncharacterized protein n=1 Tax=Eumeta variegata TaxID=151549 RepID=A0A4C1T4L3_EUMVA|nr:hypothetical protein EVAR_4027_1 [Eumeta japonica]